jgi:hypothetical protein
VIGEFYDRLGEAMFPLDDLLSDKPTSDLCEFREFRAQAEAREFAGREEFGRRYLSRDNCTDATEEAADLANYAMFDIAQARNFGQEEEWALALTAAKYAALAHRYARALRSRRAQWYSDVETTE